MALGVEVKEVFGVTVHVEGAEFVEIWVFVGHAVGAVAVGGGGGGVEEAGVIIDGPVSEGFGVFVVIFD